RAATIEVWGLQPAAPRMGAPPPVAQQRDFKLESQNPSGGAAPPTRSYRRHQAPQQQESTEAARPAPAPRPDDAPRTRGFQMPPPSARAPEALPPPPPPVATTPAAPPKSASRSLAPAADPNKPYTEVDVFFGTDRKREADRSKFGRAVAAFRTGRSNQLTLGKAVV